MNKTEQLRSKIVSAQKSLDEMRRQLYMMESGAQLEAMYAAMCSDSTICEAVHDLTVKQAACLVKGIAGHIDGILNEMSEELAGIKDEEEKKARLRKEKAEAKKAEREKLKAPPKQAPEAAE